MPEKEKSEETLEEYLKVENIFSEEYMKNEQIKQEEFKKTNGLSGEEFRKNYREKRKHSFYDTVYSTQDYAKVLGHVPEIPKIVTLFNASAIGKIGYTDLTNLQIGGVLASDQTFEVDSLTIKAWFDCSKECAERLFMLIETGVFYTMTIGDKPVKSRMQGKWVSSGKGEPWMTRTFECDFKKSCHIPARQCFQVNVEFGDEVRNELNRFTRNKGMRVYMNGEQTRDLM